MPRRLSCTCQKSSWGRQCGILFWCLLVMLRNMKNMIIKKCWWDVSLRRPQYRLVIIAKMIVSRWNSFNSSKQSMWSWYNLCTSHSWTSYLSLPQLSVMRVRSVLGRKQLGHPRRLPGCVRPFYEPCTLLAVWLNCHRLSLVFWLNMICKLVTKWQRTMEE